MIRTTCPQCGREDAVADYLATLPILCNGCGTRVTVGEPIADGPLFPPPAAPPPVVELVPPPPQAEQASSPAPVDLTPISTAPPVELEPVAPVQVLKALVSEVRPTPRSPVGLPPATDLLKRDSHSDVVSVPRSKAILPVEPVQPEVPFPLPLAGVARRLLARFLTLLGLVVMAGLGFGIVVLGGKPLSRDPYILGVILAAFPVIYLLVNAAMLARTGQDIGKRYAGVRVVNADGSKATEMSALVKRDGLTFLIGLTGVGLLYWLVDFVTLFGKGGRTLHDRIAGTRVVRA